MKNIAVFALSVLSISAAQAQDGPRFGLKAGATYSNISGKNVEQITGPGYSTELGSFKLGYNVGVAASIPVSSDGFFSFAPELLYNRKGYEIKSTSKTGTTKIEQEQQRVLHYIDVPLLARINADGLFFEFGPQVSYLFGTRSKTQYTEKDASGNKIKEESRGDFLDYTGVARGESYRSDLAQFDISGVAGVGYQTDGGVSVGLRYARGFNSLIDSKNTNNDPKAFNNAFTLQVGYLLGGN